jgi:hypothetical protein
MSLKLRFIVVITAILAAICFGSTFPAAADDNVVTAAITGENQWSAGIYPAYTSSRLSVQGDYRAAGRADLGSLNLCITGTWEGTVTLQRMFPGTAEWVDTGYTWTANDCGKRIVDTEPGVKYRLGVKTGEYTSGTVNVRLSK